MEIEILELFKTIQGEGILQGMPSIILRLPGCNLQCAWCDTKHILSNKGRSVHFGYLLEEIGQMDCRNIIITGGEPLINDNIIEITKILKSFDYHITIETNGTILKPVICDLISISPKLKNSNPYSENSEQYTFYENIRENTDILKYYISRYNYQLKFIVESEHDIAEMFSLLEQIREVDKERILITPQAATKIELMEKQKLILKYCLKYNLRYGNRLQLQLWDDDNSERKELL